MSLKSKPLHERFALSLEVGDTERGKTLFRGYVRGQCIPCHKTTEGGGDVGPDLSRIAEKRDAAYLVESLVLPDAKIAEGFVNVVLLLDDGRIVSGVIKSETDAMMELQTPTNEKLSIAKSEIEERRQAKSTMPSMESALTPRELRHRSVSGEFEVKGFNRLLCGSA
jgi:quinoprotein glucose dehydrogenase